MYKHRRALNWYLFHQLFSQWISLVLNFYYLTISTLSRNMSNPSLWLTTATWLGRARMMVLFKEDLRAELLLKLNTNETFCVSWKHKQTLRKHVLPSSAPSRPQSNALKDWMNQSLKVLLKGRIPLCTISSLYSQLLAQNRYSVNVNDTHIYPK